MLEAISDAAWTNMLYTELATVRVRTDPAFYGIIRIALMRVRYNLTYHTVHGNQDRVAVLHTLHQFDRSY